MDEIQVCRKEKEGELMSEDKKVGSVGPAEQVERCCHCNQVIMWQGRTPLDNGCAIGYWFARATGSGCPKSQYGHERHTAPVESTPSPAPIYEEAFGVWTCPICETSDDTKEALAKHLCHASPAQEPAMKVIPPAVRKMRDACHRDILQLIKQIVSESDPNCPAKFSMLLIHDTLNADIDGFGDDSYDDNKTKPMTNKPPMIETHAANCNSELFNGPMGKCDCAAQEPAGARESLTPEQINCIECVNRWLVSSGLPKLDGTGGLLDRARSFEIEANAAKRLLADAKQNQIKAEECCGQPDRDKRILAMLEPEVIFYGPHPCHSCGVIVCKTSVEHGGMAFDYPSEPIYPNTNWAQHVCRTEPNAQEIAALRRVEDTQ
jgi:hypothetical protein